jgi:opacity protein-like surface antigen
MNTNVIAPPLAKVVGIETKQCFSVKRSSSAHHSITIGLATAVLLASVSMAAAQERYPAGAHQYSGIYEPAQHGLSFSRGDRFRYGHSGTRGRDGLGASPGYPEGAGNVSD